MLTEIYKEDLLVDEDLAGQVGHTKVSCSG